MTLHQDVQVKAQAEIDSLLEGSRLPEMQDQEHLPYVRNVLKEVLRWRSVAPLGMTALVSDYGEFLNESSTGVPHACIQDDMYKGYHIPKGSIV